MTKLVIGCGDGIPETHRLEEVIVGAAVELAKGKASLPGWIGFAAEKQGAETVVSRVGSDTSRDREKTARPLSPRANAS
jgi:hypothetical protein